jgi:phage/plasmid-associated DNA primase
VDAGDAAMWRRIKVLPFRQSIAEDEQNPKIRKMLASDPRALRAILAWMVKGCHMWRSGRGLSEPPIVREASQAYREANDELNESFDEFFDDRFVLDPEGFVSGAALRHAYTVHCHSSFVRGSLNPTELNQKLRAKDLEEGQSGSKRERGWRGIKARNS